VTLHRKKIVRLIFANLAEDIESQEFSIKQNRALTQHSACLVGMASTFDEQGEPLCEQGTPFNQSQAKARDDLLKSTISPFYCER